LKKYAFIINPVAGKVKKINVSEIILTESKKFDISSKLFFTEHRGHAIEIAKKLTSNSEFDFIIAVGGDGTVNEVVNGFELNSDKIFGLLPYGSGNDVGRYLFNNRDYFQTLFDPNKHFLTEFDIGFCEIKNIDETISQRKFINAVGIGFDAYVAYLNQTGKKLTGVISYVAAVFQALKSLTSLDVELYFNSEVKKGNFLLITIGNGKTSGGGFFLNPDAKPTDGILDITTVDSANRLKIIYNLPYALIDKLKKVDLAKFYTTNEVRLLLKNPYYVHLDGEVLSKNAIDLKINLKQDKLLVITEK